MPHMQGSRGHAQVLVHQPDPAPPRQARNRAPGSVKYNRPEPSMHFMRGSINVLPEIANSIPPNADVSITDTLSEPGRRTLIITATWKEDE